MKGNFTVTIGFRCRKCGDDRSGFGQHMDADVCEGIMRARGSHCASRREHHKYRRGFQFSIRRDW